MEKMPDDTRVYKIILKDLDDFMENEEPVSEFFLLEENEESRMLAENNHIYLPDLEINVHMGISEEYNSDIGEYETDFDFYVFFHTQTKERLYLEQGSSLLTCIHNFSGLEWSVLENMECQYIAEE